MAGVDVQQFITSQRAKLNEEKVRLQDRSPRGILPSGVKASEHATKLRKEREAEYQHFLTTRGNHDYNAPSKSIAEIRRDISRERDRELSSQSDPSLVRDGLARDGGREFDYNKLKERKMVEERRYRNHDYQDHRSRWTDEKPPAISFKENHRPPLQEGSWESEEKDLVSWARQHHGGPRPPPRSSPPPSPNHTSKRSISAPTPPARGIAALGGRDGDLEARRTRQREYAESLRAQMREKDSSRPSQKQPSRAKASPELSGKGSSRSKVQESVKDKFKERSPRKDEHYSPYPPSIYPHYPPPPPPHPYYMHSYYGPPPPRDMYYPDRPDPYRYSYYPSHGYTNPYLPPHVPSHAPPRPRDDWRGSGTTRQEKASNLRRSDERRENDEKEDAYTSPIHGDETRTSKHDKTSYRKELEKQMKEKKERDLKAKLEREKYEQKKENEIYDPFGKGGCGAPVRDQFGNLVTDLKKMKKINDERTGLSPRNSQEFAKTSVSPARRSLDTKETTEEPTVYTYGKIDDGTQKKVEQESYRDFLRRQVQEKEKLKMERKEAERLEEKKELERLEKDRLKMQNDLKLERDRERHIEVELKRKNEELKKEAEIKRREAALKERELRHQQEKQEKLLVEQKMQALADKMAQPVVQQQRSRSPPIPTVMKQLKQLPTSSHQEPQSPPPQPSSPPVPVPVPIHHQQSIVQSTSPPVPTLQRKQANPGPSEQNSGSLQHTYTNPGPSEQNSGSLQHRYTNPGPSEQNSGSLQHRYTNPGPLEPKTESRTAQRRGLVSDPPTESKILSQLAALRIHLQEQLAEQMKVPPSIQQTSSVPRVNSGPRMTSGPRVRQPHSGTMDNFTSRKFKSPFPNQGFLNQFPNPPSALEVQQDAVLRYQEKRLAKMRRGQDQESAIGDLLPSATYGVPLSTADPFNNEPSSSVIPDPLSVPRGRVAGRRTSAGGQSQFSIATLDVERMAHKNEERMRRLDAILNAGTADVRGVEGGGHEPGGGVERGDDSESIIDNFLRRNNHGQSSMTRGSERSLDCETTYQRLSTPHT